MPRTITLAHSPDADDAFMFYALAKGKVDPRGLDFRHELHDIETLNQRASDGVYDVTAVSFAAWPYVRGQYALLDCGASVGDGYGPVVVSRRSLTRADLEEATVAVPGDRTTAFLVLRLFSPGVRHRVVPFDRILDAVSSGRVDAGLVIHEGQLVFAERKLARVVDLGEWWKMGTGLPLPLGGNAVKRSLGPETVRAISAAMRDSFRYALEHRAEALEHALPFARGIDRERADRFIGMYVNDFTMDLGPRGRDGLATLYRCGHDAKLLPDPVVPEFAA